MSIINNSPAPVESIRERPLSPAAMWVAVIVTALSLVLAGYTVHISQEVNARATRALEQLAANSEPPPSATQTAPVEDKVEPEPAVEDQVDDTAPVEDKADEPAQEALVATGSASPQNLREICQQGFGRDSFVTLAADEGPGILELERIVDGALTGSVIDDPNNINFYIRDDRHSVNAAGQSTSHTFAADEIIRYRARYRHADGSTSGWSPPITVTYNGLGASSYCGV